MSLDVLINDDIYDLTKMKLNSCKVHPDGLSVDDRVNSADV